MCKELLAQYFTQSPWVGRRWENKSRCVSPSDFVALVAHLARTCPPSPAPLPGGAAPGLWFSGAEAQAWKWPLVSGEMEPPISGHYCARLLSGEPAPPCPSQPLLQGTFLLTEPPRITKFQSKPKAGPCCPELRLHGLHTCLFHVSTLFLLKPWRPQC